MKLIKNNVTTKKKGREKNVKIILTVLKYIWYRTWTLMENVSNQSEARCEDKNTRRGGTRCVWNGALRWVWPVLHLAQTQETGRLNKWDWDCWDQSSRFPLQTQTTRHKLSIILFGRGPDLDIGHSYSPLCRKTQENYYTAPRKWTHNMYIVYFIYIYLKRFHILKDFIHLES